MLNHDWQRPTGEPPIYFQPEPYLSSEPQGIFVAGHRADDYRRCAGKSGPMCDQTPNCPPPGPCNVWSNCSTGEILGVWSLTCGSQEAARARRRVPQHSRRRFRANRRSWVMSVWAVRWDESFPRLFVCVHGVQSGQDRRRLLIQEHGCSPRRRCVGSTWSGDIRCEGTGFATTGVGRRP